MHRQDVTHGPHTPRHEEARLNNPSENSNQRFVARLRQEVEAWQQDGTVTAEQAQSILARYPEYAPGYEAARRRQSLVVGLSILGAILIGLSVITFFAANWNEISRQRQTGLADCRHGAVLRLGLLPLESGGLWRLRRCAGAAGLHHLRGRRASHRPDLPHRRRQPQPFDVLVPWRGSPGLRHPIAPGDGPGHRRVLGRRGLSSGHLVGGGFRLEFRDPVCGPLPFPCSVPLRHWQGQETVRRLGIHRRPLPGRRAACRLRRALHAHLP